MALLDTNMILRYLLDDNQEMADVVEEYLDARTASVTTEVIAEVVYVLKGVYSMERNLISSVVNDFLKLVSCRESDVLNIALDTYANHNLDFVDCVLYGYHVAKGATIATFDKKLQKLLRIRQ